MSDREPTTIPAPPESDRAPQVRALFDELRSVILSDPSKVLPTLNAVERFVVDQLSLGEIPASERRTWAPPSSPATRRARRTSLVAA
jgi:hypothetical protein